MEKKTVNIEYDICRTHQKKSFIINHVNDVDSDIIELSLVKNGEAFNLNEGCNVSASFVEQSTRKLIKDNMPCEIDEHGKIIIPVDNLHFRQQMDIDIEVTITDNSGNQVLTLPFPIWVRVNPSILDDAEVTDESKGTVPELMEEAKELIENYKYELTEEDIEQISEAFDLSGKENISNKKASINNQSHTGDADTNYPTVGAVRDYVNLTKNDLEDYIDDEIGNIPVITVDGALSQTSANPVQNKVVTAKLNEVIIAKADKATSLSGYGITNAYTKYEVDYALSSKANSSAIPTKTSQLSNDSGFLTQHQDISGKADKATSLSGYGITNAYTKSEVDAAIQTAIVGVENGSY